MPKPVKRQRIVIDIEIREGSDDEILTLSSTGGLDVGDVIQFLERAKIKFVIDNTTSSKEERDATGS